MKEAGGWPTRSIERAGCVGLAAAAHAQIQLAAQPGHARKDRNEDERARAWRKQADRANPGGISSRRSWALATYCAGREKQFANAPKSTPRGVDTITKSRESRLGDLLFPRHLPSERAKQWGRGEADLKRQSLDLFSEATGHVLNYLGRLLVTTGINPRKGMEHAIKRARQQARDDGYIRRLHRLGPITGSRITRRRSRQVEARPSSSRPTTPPSTISRRRLLGRRTAC